MERRSQAVAAKDSRAEGSGALRFVIVGLLGVLLAAGASSSCSDSGAKDNTAKPREIAPAFSLPVLGADASVSLESLRGKSVIIDFWATWCAPCEFQVPELNAFYEAHRADSDVAVFGISSDGEGPEVVAEWTTEKGVRYPILLAGDELARQYGVTGFPTVVVVRSDGTIDSRHAGLIQVVELEQILSAIRD